MLINRAQADHFVRGENLLLDSDLDDYNGYCKEHNIKKILLKNGKTYCLLKFKENIMTRFILNLFLIGFAVEILLWFPKILNHFLK